MDFTFGEPVLKTLLTKDTGTFIFLNTLSFKNSAIALLKTMCYAYSVPDGRLLVEAPTRNNRFKPIHFRGNRLAIGGHKQGSVHVSPLSLIPIMNYSGLRYWFVERTEEQLPARANLRSSGRNSDRPLKHVRDETGHCFRQRDADSSLGHEYEAATH